VERAEFHFEPEQLKVLKEFHRICKDKKTADRIKAVLLMADGYTFMEIERILLIDERTLHRYKWRALYLGGYGADAAPAGRFV